MPGDRNGSKKSGKSNMFTIKIMFVAVIDVGELQLFLERRGPFTSSCTTAIQALNVVLTHKPFSNMVNGTLFIFLMSPNINISMQ
jgi:eukaryotic translation initiation factor 2C